MKTTDYARLLRHLGIALIFTPEPFSTPFGVAFILVARHLSKRLDATRNARLREMVNYYLTRSSLFGTDDDVAYEAPSARKRPIVSQEPSILGQITGSSDFEAKPPAQPGKHAIIEGAPHAIAAMQGPSRLHQASSGLSDAPLRTQTVKYHKIDMERLSRRYGKMRAPTSHLGQPRASGASEGATAGPSATRSIPGRRKTVPVGQTAPNQRALDGEPLQQHRGSPASYTTVADALRENNYYYEMLSRANVIGGY